MNSKSQLVLGRVLLSVIFILSGLGKLPHFHDIAGMMAAKGIPLASVALVISLFIEIGGGLLVLTGYKAKYAALVMALWLIPVTLVFHHFWGIPAEQQQDQTVHFLKNAAILGGLLILAYVGPEKTEATA
ncbi:MAG TPA: DoxX family protein [Candidatus Dormibacteraeota bacterium]|jgi:putative oxidoreductase|nr:DoxX family protein [Candidatus Dormibacteraeota bacterium]